MQLLTGRRPEILEFHLVQDSVAISNKKLYPSYKTAESRSSVMKLTFNQMQ